MGEFAEGILNSSMTGEWSDDRSLVLVTVVMQLNGIFVMKISRISGRLF